MGRRLLKAFFVAALVSAPGIAGAGQTANSDNAQAAIFATMAGGERPAALPAILSADDATHYRAAFTFQDKAQWEAADHEIGQISQPLLMGHLLAQRYLAPSYRTDDAAIKAWLQSYADLPEAAEIRALAQHAGDHTKSAATATISIDPAVEHGDDPLWAEFPEEASGGPAHHVIEQFRNLLRQDKIERAVDVLKSAQEHRQVSNLVIDRMKTLLAGACFGDGRDAEAKKWAAEAAERSGRQLPDADWIAGLATWRGGDHAGSAPYFEAAAKVARGSSWLVSASAFWAARANLVSRRPEVFNRWLHQAAAFPHTFYGILARRMLGQDVAYSWQNRPLTVADIQGVKQSPNGLRALALLQLGDTGRAEDELRPLLLHATTAAASAVLALANHSEMPDLAVQAADLISSKGGQLPDSAEFPVPAWQPASGWTIDRALIYAFARQESFFNPNAKGRGGAAGLMQLMPATARALGAKGPLTNPGVNLDVGQRYVHHLLAEDMIKGNLCLLAASYNVGPALVAKWLQRLPQNDDALMFVESIPFHTTHAFVQHVLTNFWTYRDRFGAESPSLDAIASGQWPMYDGMLSAPATTALSMVRHVPN